MATIEEAQRSVQQAQQQAEEQQRQIQQQQLQRTRTELLQRRGIAQIPKRQVQRAEFEQQKKGALEKVKEYVAKVITPAAAKVSAVEQQQRAQQQAYVGLNRAIRKSMTRKPGFISARYMQDAEQAFKRAGLDPAKAREVYLKAVKGGSAYSFGKQVHQEYGVWDRMSPEQQASYKVPEIEVPQIEVPQIEVPVSDYQRWSEASGKPHGIATPEEYKAGMERYKAGWRPDILPPKYDMPYQGGKVETITAPVTAGLKSIPKFAGGEYKWQKKIIQKFEDREQPKFVQKIESYTEKQREKYPEGVPLVTPTLEYIKDPLSHDPTILTPIPWVAKELTKYRQREYPITEEFREKHPQLAGVIEAPAPAWVLGLSAEIPIWVAFSPWMQTGALKTKVKTKVKAKQVKKVKGKVKVEVKSLDDYIFKKEGKVFRERTFTEKLDVVRSEMNRIKELPKNIQTQELKELSKTLERVYGKEASKNLAQEFLAQEGLSYGVPKVTPKFIPEDTTKIFLEIEPVPVMGRVGEVAGLTSSLDKTDIQPEKVRETLWMGEETATKQTPRVNPFFKTAQDMKEIEQEKTAQQERQVLAVVPKIAQDFVQKTKEAQKEAQKEVQRERYITGLTFRTPQIQKQRFRDPLQPVTQKVPEKIKQTGVPIPIPWIPKRPKARAQRRPRAKLAQAYVTQVRKGGRWVTSGAPTSKGLALKKGARIARETAVATFRARPTERKIKVKGDGFIPSSEMFRGYKVVKGKQVKLKDTYIQRRRQRIKTPGEFAEITKKGIKARKSKRINFFK